MIKCTMEFSLIDLFIIKHALQSQLKSKKKKLEELNSKNELDGRTNKEIYTLNKDVEHEKELTDIFEATIKRINPKIKVSVNGG